MEDPTIPINQAYALLADKPSSTGMVVNATTVLGNPAVWRGVNLISQSVAKLPLIVYKRGPNDSRVRDVDHPAYKLLKRQPNELYSPYTFKQTIQSHALIHGNGYAYIFRDEAGKPVELLILDPETTYPYTENGHLQYMTKIDGKENKLAVADVLHIKGLGSGIMGLSVLDVMREALGLGIAMLKFQAVYIKQNGKPSLVIELPASVSKPEAIEKFRRTYGNMHQGLDNAHRPALLKHGAKLHELSGSNESGQYIQGRELDIIMVADILGCPPHKLGANIATSYKSLEAENKAFLSDSLDGWLVNWEQECYTKLLSERQKALDTHFFSFERKAIISIDAKTEAELAIMYYNNGVYSFEQLMPRLNLPTEKDPSHTYRRPANIVVEGEEVEEQETEGTEETEETDTKTTSDADVTPETSTEDKEVSELLGRVGGITGMTALIGQRNQGILTDATLVELLILFYRLEREQATSLVATLPPMSTEAPEAPVEPPEDKEVAEEAQKDESTDDPKEETERGILRSLTQTTLTRLINRIVKRPTFTAEEHRSVMIDSLAGYPQAQTFTDNFLGSLEEELAATLPEQRQEVFSRIDVTTLLEDLWTT